MDCTTSSGGRTELRNRISAWRPAGGVLLGGATTGTIEGGYQGCMQNGSAWEAAIGAAWGLGSGTIAGGVGGAVVYGGLRGLGFIPFETGVAPGVSDRFARYGGAGQRQALLNRVREASRLAEGKGIVYAFRQMRELGYELENASLHYRGNQGLDLVFSKGAEYAVVEAKVGGSLAMLKTDTSGLRQGSLKYVISRLQRYLRYGNGFRDDLANRLIDEADAKRLKSFATFYGSRSIYELPADWPGVPGIRR